MVTDITPDLAVLGRMVWGTQEQQVELADLVDPANFQTKSTRTLFLLLAREAVKGASPLTLNTIVREEAKECEPLFDQLLGATGDAGALDAASNQAMGEALTAWSRSVKFSKALELASGSIKNGAPYDDVRRALDRQLTAIDLSALHKRSYDDKADMVRRVNNYLDSGDSATIRYGFANLDRKMVPLRHGNFVLVGGASGSGKSTVIRNLVRNFVHQGIPTALLSFEMKGEEQLPNFACMDAELDVRKYVEKSFTASERKRFNDALEWWKETPLFCLNEHSSVTPEWVLRTLQRYRAEGFLVHIADHLHRVTYQADGKGEIRLAISNFAKALKSFAVDASCITMGGVQYTKLSPNQEPDDNNIRESNVILEEADAVLHVWRPRVVGDKTIHGDFVPTVRDNGSRILESEPRKGDTLGMDEGRVYIKIGKQRVRPVGGFVAQPFNPRSGLIFDIDDAGRGSYAQ